MKKFKSNKERNEVLANEIIKFLVDNSFDESVRIYFNGVYLSDEDGFSERIPVNVADYVEYYNPQTITMTFEGSFYEVMNYSYSNRWLDKKQQEFEELVSAYGLFSELGYAWSLSLYEVWE